MVLRQALTLRGIGLAIGTAGAIATTRMLAGLLFEVRPTDVWSLAGALAVQALVSLISSVVPAWRATRVDPLIALRAE
jgi:ABC-type antimicrobial peptide transport system permease subunit